MVPKCLLLSIGLYGQYIKKMILRGYFIKADKADLLETKQTHPAEKCLGKLVPHLPWFGSGSVLPTILMSAQ